ncbi:aldo/keto reductase [Streptomyces sp. RTd22]|uniref:aldo/keto reductase n=1 Tax=Streptomyces sp. RTd22 TaxID=1841249 RepID=UPI0007C52AC1|nr:aldo/keto reductase [Streptomyces sp. RTd22]
MSKSKGATLAQLSLAWLLAEKDHIVPIPDSRNSGRVVRNVAADGLARIVEIAPDGGIAGRLS